MKARNKYAWRFEGVCPINGGVDNYFATLEMEGMVVVEDLLEYCEKRRGTPTFQEDWAKGLCEAFGGKVVLRCHHRGGVLIESECEL